MDSADIAGRRRNPQCHVFQRWNRNDISIEKHHVDILINRSDIYDSGSIVTFELSNHAEELDDLSLGEMVTVHHWIDSREGKAVDARSVEPIEPNTDGNAR